VANRIVRFGLRLTERNKETLNMETLRDLKSEYHQRFDAIADYRDAVWEELTSGFFQTYVPRDGSVLDLGSGWGEFIRHIRAGQKWAMDLNEDAAERVGPGVEFLLQDCSACWPLPDNSLDVVFTSNFFEHLPTKDSLRRTLEQAFRCLRPGGRIICLGPNIRFLGGAYWDFWDHFLPLTDRSLVEILRLSGLDIERVEPRFLPYSMSQGVRPPLVLLRLYLRIPPLWSWLGKQFLVMARKPTLQS
jgi:SAM-dependent methyltransferase